MAKSKKNDRTDPNRYSKNIDIEPESKLSVLAAMGRMGLMLIGIIGIAMEFFSDGGWLKTGLGKLFESTKSMVLIPVIIIFLWFLNRWISSPNKSETKKSGDILMYAMMVVGAYYLYQLLTKGSF